MVSCLGWHARDAVLDLLRPLLEARERIGPLLLADLLAHVLDALLDVPDPCARVHLNLARTILSVVLGLVERLVEALQRGVGPETRAALCLW